MRIYNVGKRYPDVVENGKVLCDNRNEKVDWIILRNEGIVLLSF